MDDPAGALTADDLHLSNVDRTLRELQRMVKDHEDALSQVCLRVQDSSLALSLVY